MAVLHESDEEVKKAELRDTVQMNFYKAIDQFGEGAAEYAYDRSMHNLKTLCATLAAASLPDFTDIPSSYPRTDALMIALLVSLTEWLNAEWRKQIG